MESFDVNNPPPAYSPPVAQPQVRPAPVPRHRPVSAPIPFALVLAGSRRSSIINRNSGPPPSQPLPTPPRRSSRLLELDVGLEHLEECAAAVNTGRNGRGRPNPINLGLLPFGFPGSPQL